MKCKEEELEAARALLLLCNRSDSNHFPSADLQNPISMSLKNCSSSFLQPWGFRSKRSSCACSRPSPSTPLDFRALSCDPSTSGSSESFRACSDFAFVKRLCTSDASASRSEIDVAAKFSEVERFPLVEAALTSSKPIRRQGRKKTVAELQAHEKSLREEKTMLMKLVESKRNDVETLIAENESLKSEMVIFQRARATTEAAKPAAFLLPDLNEPLLMESLVT